MYTFAFDINVDESSWFSRTCDIANRMTIQSNPIVVLI